MNYVIPNLNGQTEIKNPTIEIVNLDIGNPNISNINFQTKKHSIEIHLVTPRCTYGLLLDNVQAESLDWTSGQDLPAQVLIALNEQFGVE